MKWRRFPVEPFYVLLIWYNSFKEWKNWRRSTSYLFQLVIISCQYKYGLESCYQLYYFSKNIKTLPFNFKRQDLLIWHTLSWKVFIHFIKYQYSVLSNLPIIPLLSIHRFSCNNLYLLQDDILTAPWSRKKMFSSWWS